MALQPFEKNRRSLLAAPLAVAPGIHVVLELFDKQPLNAKLSGLALEYRILSLYSRDSGIIFQPHHQPFNYFTRFAPGTADRDQHLQDGAEFLAAIERGTLPHVAFYKPAGVVTTAHDPQGRPTVVDLVGHQARIVPVGRLDVDTTGALLLTNDGELAHRLAHPRYEVEKLYEATVEGEPDDAALKRLESGVELDDGRTAPARVRRLAPSTLELAIHEGRKHQVKRMLEAVGHPVTSLHRSRYAGLTLEGLEPGAWRELDEGEIKRLREAGGR